MKDAHRAAETFDSIAEHFDKTRNRPWKEVEKFLDDTSGKTIDIGCGNGRHSEVAVNLDHKVVCLDASIRLLKITMRKLKDEAEYVRSGIKKMPFKDKSFDNVVYIAAIHHLKTGRINSLKETNRILKTGGKMIVSSWAREQERWDLNEDEQDVIVPWTREDGKKIERFYHLYRLEELKTDVENAGFYITTYFHSKGNNYVIAEK
ncbi:MAG: class I SAM-dependent methyltransferase [Thermoplasmatota archaeon]